jgi:hypothetical protein
MHLTGLAFLHWAVGFALEALICVLAIRREVLRRLPSFMMYIVLLLLNNLARGMPLKVFGLASPQYFWGYWVSEAVLVAARGALVVDITFRVLSPYRGVWRLCRRSLIALAAILGCAAAITSRGSAWYLPYLVLSIDRGLELSVVGILLFVLVFCRHYGVAVDRMIALIALGISLYSVVQVANNTFLIEAARDLFPWWTQVRLISYEVVLVVWLSALWKPLPSAQPTPQLLEPGVYALVSSQVSGCLRELNARLEEMLR